MTTPAANIQDAINYSADNIGQLAYTGAVSIKTKMTSWINALFGTGGIFTDVASAPQRTVIDWRIPSDQASAAIEGAGAGQCGVVGTNAVIDAVTRTLCAVKQSTLSSYITSAQQTATVAAFNLYWT